MVRTQLWVTRNAAGSSWRPRALRCADSGTTSDLDTTDAGSTAVPACSQRSPDPSTSTETFVFDRVTRIHRPMRVMIDPPMISQMMLRLNAIWAVQTMIAGMARAQYHQGTHRRSR